MYSRIQAIALVVSAIGVVVMLYFTKQFHDMDAGYLPYFAFAGAFVCSGMFKGVLLSPYDVELVEEED